jgi:hypothetical protein
MQVSWLFISLSDKNRSTGKPIENSVFDKVKPNTIPQLTVNGYKIQYRNLFQKLLIDPEVSNADKALIRNILTKPLNLYIMRHSALTYFLNG